jgi:hypothetical protein
MLAALKNTWAGVWTPAQVIPGLRSFRYSIVYSRVARVCSVFLFHVGGSAQNNIGEANLTGQSAGALRGRGD